jgi:HAD superfamily hydrolase (TIGR01490 family)
MKRPFAAFDIDGTIFRWQLYHELFDAFVENGLISPKAAETVLEAREAWRERRADYESYEMTLVRVMKASIVGVEVDQFSTIADAILKSKGHHIYKYTLDLLKDLKAKGYAIVAISGSYQQLVDRFAALHDIDIAVGREHVIENGRLTEQSSEIFGRKDEILRDIAARYDLEWSGSYAIGDSSGDTKMLEIVDNPIAFNPDEKLKAKAMQEGWTIVIERKSVAYTLERGPDGTYVLA